MLGKLEMVIKSAAELSWQKLVILLIFIGILLGGFYGYRRISALEFKTNATAKALNTPSPEDRFIEQFGTNYIDIDANIHNYLARLRRQTEADWVLFFGIHNGQNIGPYHLKKISIIDESVEMGNNPLYQQIQDVPMTLFSSSYPIFEDPDTVVTRHADEASEDAMAELVRNGIQYEISGGVYIDGIESPIGFIGLFYKGLKADTLSKKEKLVKPKVNQLEKTRGLVEYELNRMYILGQNE